jgi:hypothetical protein
MCARTFRMAGAMLLVWASLVMGMAVFGGTSQASTETAWRTPAATPATLALPSCAPRV